MSDSSELLLRSVVIGVGATLTMDLWAALLRRLGVPSLRLALLGRWIGHLLRGRLAHDDIARAPAIRGESLIGLVAHYAIGVSFAGLLIATAGLAWAREPTLLPALSIGALTVAAPWLVLQPAIGAGVASSKTSRPSFNATKSLVTHLVFGAGLYLAARVTENLV